MGIKFNPLSGGFDLVNDKAEEIKYTPTTPADWPVVPADVKEALDELAANAGGGGGGVQRTIDTFSGNGVLVNFTLSIAPTNEDYIDVFIGGVYQYKDRYSLAGAVVTFVTPPPTGTSNIQIITSSFAAVTGVGVPVGGTTGQVLSKVSNANYDLQWSTPAASGLTLTDLMRVSVNNWVLRTPTADNNWRVMAFGNGVFVAMSTNSTATMVSRNGADWVAGAVPLQTFFNGIAFGAGLFVAVGDTRIYTSPDGITWTARTNPTGNQLRGVAFGGGQFVIVGSSGTNNRVLTSPDGITWTARTTPGALALGAVGFGNGVFVAVPFSGGGAQFLRSTDGITWTAVTSPADSFWASVAYGNGLFVAVSFDGTNKIATSPDGITWTSRTSAPGAQANALRAVNFAEGFFVTVSESGTGNRIQVSQDGITWRSVASPANNSWDAVAYGNGVWVSVAEVGTTRAMSSLNLGI